MGVPETPRGRLSAIGSTDGLALAATPVFAVMAVLTTLTEGHPSASHGSALGGMPLMYALMSLAHLTPWLRLVRGGARPPR